MEGPRSLVDRRSSWCAGAFLLWTAVAAAADCNRNGLEDAEEVLPHGFRLEAGGSFEYEDPAILAIAADLSGDGALDIVAPSVYSDRLPVFLNHGDGTLENPIYYTVNQFSSNAVAADLDGDGWLDLASPGVWVLLNRGGGAFADPVPYPVSGSVSYHILAGDFDGDGDVDLVENGGGLWVLRNRGDGTFEEPLDSPVVGTDVQAVTADFDGVNGPDLAAVQQTSRDFLVLLNRGDGTFGEATPYPAGVDATFVLEAADLDGNGAPDLVAPVGGSPDVAVLINLGDGTFAGAVGYHAGGGIVSLVAADFTGDGKLDIATGNNAAGTVGVLLQGAGGVFDRAVEVPARRNTSGVTAADLDLDGDADIVAGSGGAGTLLVLVNDGAGGFSPLDTDITVGGSIATITADVDGSGTPDVIIPTVRGITVIFNRTQPPASRDGNRNGIPDGCETGTFHRGDANGDGPTDMSDTIWILSSLFGRGDPPRCRDAADANDDGALNISDAIFLFDYLFRGTSPPPYPGTLPAGCGFDPGESGAGRSPSLGCDAYDGC